MSAELDAFRAELRAAGQPFSLWGFRVVAAGFVVLIVAQTLAQFAMVLLGLAIALIIAGWGLLVIAFARRRRWAKANPALASSEFS